LRCSEKSRRLLIVLAACLVVAPRLIFLQVPFERDEGCYAYVSDTIDRGDLPYRDAFDHKPPGIYYLYNLSFKLFGRSVEAPRVTALFFSAVAALLTHLLVRKLGGTLWAGVVSMAFLGLASASPVYTGFDANTEIFTLPFLLGGCVALLGRARTRCRFFTSGLLFGLGFVIKQVAAAVAVPVFLCAAFRLRKEPRTLIIASLLFVVGAAAPFACFTLYFTANGAFHEFWEGFFVYNSSYVGEVPWAVASKRFLSRTAQIVESDPFLWSAATGGILLFLVSERRSFRRWFLTASLVGSFAATALGRYFYPHYYVVLLPFLAAAIGVGMSAPRKEVGRGLTHTLGTALFLASLVFQARFFTLPNDILLENLYGTNPFFQSTAVGGFLRSRATPDSTVFIVGSEAQILFYSGLRASSRIFYCYPLVTDSPLRRPFRGEVLESLESRPPRFVLLVNSVTSHMIVSARDEPYIRAIRALLSGYRSIGFSPFGSREVLCDPVAVRKGLQSNAPGSIMVYERILESRRGSKP